MDSSSTNHFGRNPLRKLHDSSIQSLNTKSDDYFRLTSNTPTPTWSISFEPPQNTFFDVIVQYIEELDPTLIWVTEIKYDANLKKLLAEINRTVAPAEVPACKAEELTVGALVAAPLDKVFYRAQVIETHAEQNMCTVRLIDYGNEMKLPNDKLKAAIPIMSNLNAYAFRIKVPKNVIDLQLESVITIRLIGPKSNEDFWFVDLKPKALPKVLPLEILSENPQIRLCKIFENATHALVQLTEKSEICKSLNEYLSSEHGLKFDFDTLPQEGAYVAAHTKNGWARACFFGFSKFENKYLVYLLDMGRLIFSSMIKKIPDAYIKHPLRVFAIAAATPNTPLSEHELMQASKLTLHLNVAANPKASKSLPCSLYADDKKIMDVIATQFTGLLKELNLKYWIERIPEGSSVTITHVYSHAEVCINSELCLSYPNMFADMAASCIPFAEKDTIAEGDLVLAKTEEEDFYLRGEVREIKVFNFYFQYILLFQVITSNKSQDTFKIWDVDSGAAFDIPRSRLLHPNLFIISCPVYMQRVKLVYLEAIPSPMPENKAVDALNQCVINFTEFDLKYEAEKPNTVDLFFKTPNKESLSMALMPRLFEKCTSTLDKAAASNTENATKTNNTAGNGVAEDTPLPPSPPDSPIELKPANVSNSNGGCIPKQQINVKATYAEANKINLNSSHLKMPNLDVQSIEQKAAATTFFVDDLQSIALTEGDNVPLLILDYSTAKQGIVTAADFSKKDLLTKNEVSLATVAKYGKCNHQQKGYKPKYVRNVEI